MSEEKTTKKDELKDDIAEVASAIKESIMAQIKDDLADVKKTKKVKKEESMKVKVTGAYDYAALDRQSVRDLAKDNLFSEEVVKRYIPEQKSADDIKMKNYIWWRAFFAKALDPYQPRYAEVLKALSEGTAADGGYLVTDEFRTEVLRQLHLNGVFRPEVNVIPTTTDTVQFNSEDGRPTVSWGSENTTISTTTAGLAQTSISVSRLNSLMYMSREVVADSSPSIVDWITAEFADSIRNEEDAVIATGSGSGRPTGLSQISGFTSRVCSGTLSFEDWVNLEHDLPPQYRIRGNCKWYMHDHALRDTRLLKDSQNQPIFLRSLDGSTPNTLLGYPVVVSNNLPEKTVFFGDLKRTYILLDRQQLSVETTTEGAGTFEKHQLAIKVTERIGGNAVRKEALVKGLLYSA